MKRNEIFATLRRCAENKKFKRSVIWLAVVLLTIPVMRPLTFLIHYVSERTTVVYKFALGIVVVFLIVWLILAILKWCKLRPLKRFALFCAGTAVVIYFMYAVAFFMCIRNYPTEQGAIAVEGVHALYNPIGCRKVKFDKPYMYIAEYYNIHLRERCYVAIYANQYSWVDATGLIEIDLFDSDWKPLDRCAAMIVQPEKGEKEFGTYLGEVIGIETKRVYSTNTFNSWDEYQNEYAGLDYRPAPIYRGYQFETYSHRPVRAFDLDYNDGDYYGWADRDFYDETHKPVGRSFKHLMICELNRPAYMDK